MPDSRRLLADLRRLLTELEGDLLTRADSVAEVGAALRAEYASARRVGRTADAYEVWREEPITQAAVAWVLGTVFVRFLEDTGLIEAWLSGPGERRRRALDRHTLYFQQHPTESDREYLQHVFRTVGQLPAGREIFDLRHNPLWQLPISGDAAKALLEFWQRIDPATGETGHVFTDPDWDTRFLGDLYQDLSEPARQKYALLQTPRFVEAFILDRTLTPAIATFGYREVRVIDPTCGSGHFLLGAFDHLLALWLRDEPGTNARVLVQRALTQVAGVDLNPFAVAIARFRLLVAALLASGITRLADSPAFHVEVAVGDSLLHGRRFTEEGAVQQPLDPDDPTRHHFAVEDPDGIDRILGRQYHAVVGNPPYITVKDKALTQLYRQRYGSCHGKYSLVVPFLERFFDLAISTPGHTPGSETAAPASDAGFVGLIVANSFMKREFGKKLIEEYLPRWDITHVVDTSGAYIPGHGTPTVILFGRHRRPVAPTRTVMGIRGEPSTPDDPARGQVWSAILEQIDIVGSESAFVSVRDLDQTSFHSHPWSIGGGGAAELKELLDERGEKSLGEVADSIGITSFTLEDDIFLLAVPSAERHRIEQQLVREMVVGEAIRDWCSATCDVAVFPYDGDFKPLPLHAYPGAHRYLWMGRTCLANNKMFGGRTKVESGLQWFEFGRLTGDKLRTPLSIAFAEVATHNHFVLDCGCKVFNRTAPVIKLPADATEDDHLALLGLLNSSTACFWFKQVCNCKGLGGQGGGIKPEDWHRAYVFNSSNVGDLPIPPQRAAIIELTRGLCTAAQLRTDSRPARVLARGVGCLRKDLDSARRRFEALTRQMVALQEELDWALYAAFGLTTAPQAPSPVLDQGYAPDDRPVEQLLRARMTYGESSIYYDTHAYRGAGHTEAHVSAAVEELARRRLIEIRQNRALQLVETPNFKRRWQEEPWEQQQERTLGNWLLDRLETARYWPSPPSLQTTARLADAARQDTELMTVAEVYRGRADFDITALVTELMMSEAVPFLAVLRYTDSGTRKRALWERTWDFQRREDAIDARTELPANDPRKLTAADARRVKASEVGEIPVPPKYTSADFRKGDYWRLRGKLDVPKERFIVYPGAERVADPTPAVAWAGWDHLQQAQALSAYYVRMQEQEGWTVDRLTPLLAGLLELVPWLRQWHNAVDPAYGQGLGDYFAGFVEDEARRLGLTLEAVRTWAPPIAQGGPRNGRGTSRGRRRAGVDGDTGAAEKA